MQAQSRLFLHFTEREIKSRFADSGLGLLWALLGPLLLLAIYSFVFGQLFKQRAVALDTDSYTLFVATALWPWMMFADGVSRGMQSIQQNASLVKKVAFPHFLLVASAVTAAFTLHLIGYAAVLVALAAGGSPIHLGGVPLAMAYIIVLYVFTLGVAALLAALQTLIRDVEQAVNPAIMMLHYLTPVLYPLSMIPENYRGWLDWNPLALIVTRIRSALLADTTVVPADLGPPLIALVALCVGAWVFARLSPYFEDFL
jgi:lipopolysaccharide transport system permease protein